MTKKKVAPARVRGLKSALVDLAENRVKVAPARVRGLK